MRASIAIALVGLAACQIERVQFAGDADIAGGPVVSATELVVAETADTTFTVSLGAAPGGTITVDVVTGDDAEVGVTPATLQFTPEDFATPQLVTVTGRDDTDTRDEVTPVTVRSEMLSGSHTIDVTVLDDDGVRLVATPTSALEVDEGENVAVAVRLAAAPATPVTATLGSSDPTIAVPSPGTLMFDATNWDIDQMVTVTAPSDVDSANEPITITLAGPGLVDAELAVLVVDDDVLGLDPSVTVAGPVAEDGNYSFTVRLTELPPADVTAMVMSDDATVLTALPPTLVFTTADWNVPHPVTVTGVQDADSDDETVHVILTAPGMTTRVLAIAVADDD